jgi:hypothetical protein
MRLVREHGSFIIGCIVILLLMMLVGCGKDSHVDSEELTCHSEARRNGYFTVCVSSKFYCSQRVYSNKLHCMYNKEDK